MSDVKVYECTVQNGKLNNLPEDVLEKCVGMYCVAIEKNKMSLYTWTGQRLTPSLGTINGPSGKETYYNLNMSGVIAIMRRMGNTDPYWVREDGCKMLGPYIMVAAHLGLRPRGSLVETSLGTGIVCDTGGFALTNPYQIDIAVNW